ncbi:uncharacterized protein DUF975 [Paenibacillus cellulosilyticus]|uniref:Uncharacterized protein DUF975 n=1 Tax=Paenibacillus cellulosilyticus TaxID=375489 RepID=A0A2V2YUV2_9BACL|nr:DUF975 family protein [Paenibacillus cellulosilyticus]PWW05073.1 uncharacterized protein DUF975 [Paenibacillus cellulosilyticus]QKS48627.1 DUF975 family protein [Paenibacillus cellulosilyticus]
MNVSYSEFRRRARESLRGQWGKSVGAILLASIPSFILAFLGLFSHTLKVAGDIMSYVIAGMIALGTAAFFLGISRHQKPPAKSIYQGFNNPGKAFLLYILMAIFICLWTLLLIIPGIIAAYRYSQAYYILTDNPNISPLEAIRRSKEMMVGHKWRLFVLQLTFIGWALLCILTLGIGYLWLGAYISVASAHFYDEVNNQGEKPPAPLDLSKS